MEGILTKQQEKFYSKLIAEEIPVSGIWKLTLNWALPILISAIDNNYGSKVPPPWKEYAMQLFTSIHLAFQDGVFTKEEEDQIIDMCAHIINKEVDVPLLEEEQEAVVFIQLLKLIASLLKKKVDETK